MINWNLSRSHTRADVGGKGDKDLDFHNVESVRIELPRELVYEAEGKDVQEVIVHFEGDLIKELTITFEEQTAEDVVKQARALAAKYGFTDNGSLDEFLDGVREKRAAKEDESSAQARQGAGQPDGTKLNLDEPAVGLTILNSFGEKRPWLIDLGATWFYGDSYIWDFTKQHTVSELRFFPKDKADYTIDSITALNILMPGGKEFRVEGREGEARLTRNGETLTVVHTLFGEPSPEEAHKRAVALAGEWGVPTGPLDVWLADVNARKARGENETAAPPVFSAGPHADGSQPVISVGLHWEERYRLDLYELPWVVDFMINWP